MKMVRTVCCAIAILGGYGTAQAQLYSENFDANATADWTVNLGPTDSAANFFFDYSSVGIPSAPNSTGGTTRGMKLQANLINETFGGFSVSPTGQSFTGDYTVNFDIWSNYNGPLEFGGSGSTNLSTYGVLTSGTTANYAGAADSVFFAHTGDAGSSSDWRAYSSDQPASYPEGDPVYADPAGNRNHTGEIYQVFGGNAAPQAQIDLFPQQTEMTLQGAAGMTWHEVQLFKGGDVVSWVMDGVLLASVDTSTFTTPVGGTNILFGHSDINLTSSGDPNAADLLFTLVDNVAVTMGVPVTDPIWNKDGSGDWLNDANWNFNPALGVNNLPDDNTETATFGGKITSARTVFAESDVTVKSIVFDNANEYVIAGNGTVNLEADAGNASMEVVLGAHQFQADVNLNSATGVDVATGQSLALNNALSLGANTLTKTGGGTLQINNAQNSGSGTVVAQAGFLGGVGLVSGDLDNTGATVLPGTSAGTLSVGGNYSQSSSAALQIEIGGTVQDEEYDLLAVDAGGTATLDGTLDINLVNGFNPAKSDAFSVITAGAVSGVFAAVDATGAALDLTTAGFQLEWLTDYAHAGEFELLVGVRGDMDLDGDVDFDDIDDFVQGLNSPATYFANIGHGAMAAGDMDQDGDQDFDDIAGFVTRLQNGAPITDGSHSVPEPSAWMLAALALAGISIWRFQRLPKFMMTAVMVCVALVLQAGIADAQLYSENFDANATANWTLNPGPTDSVANFFFDYSSVGIPSAPNSTGGTTRGMKLQANLLSETFGGFSVSPTGEVFAGDYTVTFDIWSNFNGPFPDGGSGSTNLSTYGVLTSGATANYPGVADGVWFAHTGDGGSSADYRAYSPDAVVSYQDGDPVYTDPSRNAPGATYQVFGSVEAPAEQLNLFPQQMGTTQPGSAGMEWHTVELFVNSGEEIVTWSMDGTILASVDTTGMALGGGNILFGHSDINLTSSTDPNADDLLFTLVDNVAVTTGIVEFLPIWNSDASGDWNTASNWEGLNIPEGNTETAIFGSKITAPRSVFTESDVTVEGIRFNNANEYALVGNGSINLDADSASARIDVDLGSHQIQTVVNLADPTTVDAATGTSLDFNNAVNLNGNDLTKTGNGTVRINNALNTGGGNVIGLGGLIAGDGSIDGTLLNAGGTVAPGNSPGRLSVGAYAQGSQATLQIEIGGYGAGHEHDVLAVEAGGAAQLDGTLDIDLIGDFAPNHLDAFVVVTGGTVSGAFSIVDGSGAALGTTDAGFALEWLTDYADTQAIALLVGVRGDMDLDGDIDFDDIDALALGLASAEAYQTAFAHGAMAAGDTDQDGDLDFDDIGGFVHRLQAGAMLSGGSQSVPEPSTWVLALLGLAALAAGRRYR